MSVESDELLVRYLYVLSPGATSYEVFALEKSGVKSIQTFNYGNEAKGVDITPVFTVGAAVHIL